MFASKICSKNFEIFPQFCDWVASRIEATYAIEGALVKLNECRSDWGLANCASFIAAPCAMAVSQSARRAAKRPFGSQKSAAGAGA